MKVVVDAEGVQAPGYRFVPPDAKPTPWQARWIVGGRLRKEVTLDVAPGKVTAWIMAEAPYRLWVNGRLVSRGPVDQGRDFAVAAGVPFKVVFGRECDPAQRWHKPGMGTERGLYDCRDLTPFFRTGRNVIAVDTRGPILFEAQADNSTVKSDTTWRLAPGNLDDGWQTERVDDARWSVAKETEGKAWPLLPSEIPARMEAYCPALRIEGLPENRVLTGDGQFKVVFDRVLSAYATLKVKGGKGAAVTVFGSQPHRKKEFKVQGGEQMLESDRLEEFPPSYTVQVKNVSEPLEIVDAGAIFTSQPVEYRGRFECNDGKLNAIWKASRWAAQICMQTHHLDSPNHQEPLGCAGDYAIEAMVGHYAFAQPWLARQDIRKLGWIYRNAKYHPFHTSYSICWLRMLMDYYDYTGDQLLVEEMSPFVHELMDTYTSWRGKNGLLSEAPNYMFMDWVKIGGFSCHHPPAVIGQGYLTAFFCHGLDMASRVAALSGDTARVKKYAQLRKETAEAFNRELWNEKAGLYRDGKPFQTSVQPCEWLPADRDIETFSPHVNSLAVLFDLAPKQRQAAIMEKVLAEKPLNTQMWFMHWVFQAIDHAGLFDRHGTAQMRRWDVVPETQSFYEMWDHKTGKAGGDLSHGWCSTPLVQMSQRILGVEPTTPGFKTMAIHPRVCDLTWAKGVVPTPHGDVLVSWKWADDKLALAVTVPPGTEADVILPGKTVHVKAGRHSVSEATKRK